MAFPELARASVRPLTMSWHLLAVEAEERPIFKFPRGARAERARLFSG
jgi:hypothetical protein